MRRTVATIAVAIVAGAATGSITTQLTQPQPASALDASDVAQLKRVVGRLDTVVGRLDTLHEDVATLNERVGATGDTPGVWGEIRRLRADQARMCRALMGATYAYQCPTQG
jgi:hypothetical protein